MNIVAQLCVQGFTSDKVKEDIPSLLEEFRGRDVFLETRASWNAEERKIYIQVVVEGKNATDAKEMIYDEVFDAVIASIRALDSIELNIDSCKVVGPE